MDDLPLVFDTDSPDFLRGFEAGALFERLKASLDDNGLECLAHTENAEMLLRMAEATLRTVRSEELGDGFLGVCFSPVMETEAPA